MKQSNKRPSACFVLRLLIASTLFLSTSAFSADLADGGEIDGVEFVNVRHEPQHRHEFENDQLRIYDVLLPPDYVTLHHAHTRDTIYVVIKGSTLTTKAVLGADPAPVTTPVPSGIVMWNQHTQQPLVHEVHNIGAEEARLLGIELKGHGDLSEKGGSAKDLETSWLHLMHDFSRVRVYTLRLKPGARSGVVPLSSTGVLIGLQEATLARVGMDGRQQVSSLEPASWMILEPVGDIRFVNEGESDLEALLYELL